MIRFTTETDQDQANNIETIWFPTPVFNCRELLSVYKCPYYSCYNYGFLQTYVVNGNIPPSLTKNISGTSRLCHVNTIRHEISSCYLLYKNSSIIILYVCIFLNTKKIHFPFRNRTCGCAKHVFYTSHAQFFIYWETANSMVFSWTLYKWTEVEI